MTETNNPLHALSYVVFDWCMANCEPKVALDIGANIGGNTFTMVEKGFSVHAFEPAPQPFAELYSRFSKDFRVKCHNVALADKEYYQKDINVMEAWTLGTPETTGLSIKPEYKNLPNFDVQFTTIDKFVTAYNLKIGFVKLDVDGYELKVLKGGEKTIRQQMPPMMIELSLYIEKVGDSIEEFVRFIFDLGYRMISMDGYNIFFDWDGVKEHYPYNTSFDVMLLSKEDSEAYGQSRELPR